MKPSTTHYAKEIFFVKIKIKKENPIAECTPAPEKPSLSHFHYGNTTELGATGQFVTSLDSSGSVRLSLDMGTTSLDSSGSVAPG